MCYISQSIWSLSIGETRSEPIVRLRSLNFSSTLTLSMARRLRRNYCNEVRCGQMGRSIVQLRRRKQEARPSYNKRATQVFQITTAHLAVAETPLSWSLGFGSHGKKLQTRKPNSVQRGRYFFLRNARADEIAHKEMKKRNMASSTIKIIIPLDRLSQTQFDTMGENKQLSDTDSDVDKYNGDHKKPSFDEKAFDEKEDQYLDSWRGWIVVAAASCSLFIYLGVIYSWGVLAAELVKTTSFSLTTLTFVGSLATSFMVSLSILVGMTIRRLGYQKTAFVGAILMGLGEFLASWVTDHLAGLFICHSVLFGVGGGLTIMVC